MDPPEQVQNVFLKTNNNDVSIYFKTFLNKPTNIEDEISKDNFLEYILHFCNNIKYSLDTSNKILNITGIKVLSIVNSSALSKKRLARESMSFLMNYESSYSTSENKLIIKGILQVHNGNTLMCTINNIVIMVEISTDKFQKKKYLTFKLTYTNSADDINAFHKKNMAHSLRTLIIPFKLSLE